MINDDETLLRLLYEAGFPAEVVRDHLDQFRALSIEIRASEQEFWGKYFVRSAKQAREWGKKGQK
jgi:hypothetical protein